MVLAEDRVLQRRMKGRNQVWEDSLGPDWERGGLECQAKAGSNGVPLFMRGEKSFWKISRGED